MAWRASVELDTGRVTNSGDTIFNPLLADDENPATPSTQRRRGGTAHDTLTPTVDRLSWLLPSALAQRARQLEVAPMRMAHEGHALLASPEEGLSSWREWMSRWQGHARMPGFVRGAVDTPFHDCCLLGALFGAQHVVGLSVLVSYLGVGEYPGASLHVHANLAGEDLFLRDARLLAPSVEGRPHGWGVATLSQRSSFCGNNPANQLVWAGELQAGVRHGPAQLTMYSASRPQFWLHCRGVWRSGQFIDEALLNVAGGLWRGTLTERYTLQVAFSAATYSLTGRGEHMPQLKLAGGPVMRSRAGQSLTEDSLHVDIELADGRQLDAVVRPGWESDENGRKIEGPLSPWKMGFGLATMTYPNGDVFQGKLSARDLTRKNGRATYIDGSIYEGRWRDDRWQGSGEWTRPDGWRLVGSFDRGLPHGAISLCAPGRKGEELQFVRGRAMAKDYMPEDLVPRQPAQDPGSPAEGVSTGVAAAVAQLQQDVRHLQEEVVQLKRRLP